MCHCSAWLLLRLEPGFNSQQPISFPIRLRFLRLTTRFGISVSLKCQTDKPENHQDCPSHQQPVRILDFGEDAQLAPPMLADLISALA
jgi:hypothetical protein